MKMKILLTFLILILLMTSCTTDLQTSEKLKEYEEVELGIHETTFPDGLKMMHQNNPRGPIPDFDPSFMSGIELRAHDLTKFDLTDRLYELLNSDWDTQTVWPEALPEGFDPNKILEYNKTPGLNIKKLHEKGIDGNGVGVGIIDYPLLDHTEINREKLKYYDHIHYPDRRAHFHGSMVASIIAGQNIGIAPEADLYFIANFNLENVTGQQTMVYNYNITAESVRKIIAANRSLPEEEKIRVLSISMGWEPEQNGYDELREAIDEANNEGIFVVSANLFEHNEEFHFHGLYKDPLADPDHFESYKPYPWDRWLFMMKKPFYNFETYYEKHYDQTTNKKVLLIPMGSITTASASGSEEYTYHSTGGWSSAIPYISGLYTLACQVKPDVTPEEFWNAAYETGVIRSIEKDGKEHEARIPHPEKLIEYLQNK